MNTPLEDDASRRTQLASERTQLAWWRTGLTALAVAVGVGRVVPELDKSASEWPYVVLGLGFAFYGLALFAIGDLRGRRLASALARGEFERQPGWVSLALAVVGGTLALATAALIVLA
jgi:putative membrane protein